MNISSVLVTAVGSFSTDCVVDSLRKKGVSKIIGCDIYPAEWHAISDKLDVVYHVPKVVDENVYLKEILKICKKENIQFILPLTDVEVDFYNLHRNYFSELNIVVCIPSSLILELVRNKFNLYKFFFEDEYVPSIKTFLATEKIFDPVFPYIAKPVDGRSSQGIHFIKDHKELDLVKRNSNHILQEFIEGPVYTVDYIRSSKFKTSCCVSRQELLRTKNGAGETVKIEKNEKLESLTSYIGDKLEVNGCVNMEFIRSRNKYYLIDINPRFSAGINFSLLAGYDMVGNHLNCYMGEQLDGPCAVEPMIIAKKYSEVITKRFQF